MVSRLAYKSSSGSAKRDRPRTLLRSAKRDRQSSRERARSASERELVPNPFNKKLASDFEKV